MARISILTPVYNEEATVRRCYDEVKRVFGEMGGRHTYEHLFGDNRSKDKTLAILREIAAHDPNVKVLAYSRNFGAEKSGLTLLRHASGDACLALAADLQEPPDLIPRLIAEWEAGNEIAMGIYTNRSDGLITKALRKTYYKLVNWASQEDLDEDASGFALLDRRVVDEMCRLDDYAPYLRGFVSTVGFNKAFITYERAPRTAGKSKHNFSFLFDFGLNGIISYSILPIRLATYMGLILSGCSLVMSLIYAIIKILHWNFQAPGATTTIVLLLFFFGIQLLFLGILGEYIGAIHSQVRRKPFCLIREKINFPSQDQAR